MITLRFGFQADMLGKSFTSPALNTTLGDIGIIQGHTSTRVTAGTAKGGSLVFEGKFKFSNDESLRNSDVTGVSFFDKSHHLLVSVSGVPAVDFEDVGRQEKPQLMMSFMLQKVAQGVTVQGSTFDDVLVGYAGNDKLFGNAGDDTLRSAAGSDVLDGGSGADLLDGGAGKDVMTGGKGNDVFIVESASDVVVESVGGGIDQVNAGATWTLAAQVENLVLTGSLPIAGTGNAGANSMLGNGAANILRGAGGNDVLDGGRGADSLLGGPGDDIFVVDKLDDRVQEFSHQGSDTVRASVSYSLPANVEKLVLGGSANLHGTGNGLDNLLRGNDGNNTLDPGHGHDILTGGKGADNFVLSGGHGDRLSITDLLSGTDHLFLTPSAVSAIAHGALHADQLRASTATADGNDFLVYNKTSGVLSYDHSGHGSGALVTLASLGAHTVLLAGDITIGLPHV